MLGQRRLLPRKRGEPPNSRVNSDLLRCSSDLLGKATAVGVNGPEVGVGAMWSLPETGCYRKPHHLCRSVSGRIM